MNVLSNEILFYVCILVYSYGFFLGFFTVYNRDLELVEKVAWTTVVIPITVVLIPFIAPFMIMKGIEKSLDDREKSNKIKNLIK